MTSGPSASEIEIRRCTTLEDYEECIRIEHITWGQYLAEPIGMFVVARHTGGQVIGAFDGPKMIGFTMAVAGIRDGRVFLHSHQTAVLAPYQDRGIGSKLKLFQREDALEREINLVEWTFDPLELKNAYFNLVRLGAVTRRLIPNCYGVTKSPLHSGLPTDRFVAEWWLDSPRVKAILDKKRLADTGPLERISLPPNINEIKSQDPKTALRLQARLRGQLLGAFAKGQVATSVERQVGRTDYVLENAGQIAGLDLSEWREH